MNIANQFEHIMAVPLGAAVIAAGLSFFVLLACVIKHLIKRRAEQIAERNARRDLADDLASRFEARGSRAARVDIGLSNEGRAS